MAVEAMVVAHDESGVGRGCVQRGCVQRSAVVTNSDDEWVWKRVVVTGGEGEDKYAVMVGMVAW